MLFSQTEFYVFIAVVFCFLLLVRHYKTQKLFLLFASYYFYAYWDWRFLGLILASTIVDYLVAQGLKKTDDPRQRKTLLIVSLVVNFSLLGFFKYFNFFVGSLSALLAPLGLHLGTLQIILPVGISFYTFQTLSYTIDVYRRRIDVCDNYCDFALFVAFFPQLVAGPIVRAADFLPQLQQPRKMSWARTFDGGRQFVFGLFKKVFIADRVAVFVDYAFENADAFNGATMWLAVIAYAFQIYCDFSGYSDMAIGVARIMGYDIPMNFNLPYIAKSIDEFWHRWHISLSSWLRDYLYISLGGNRKGLRRTYVNLMVTMLLGGLWHGASWTFVFWGAWHGGALAVNKFVRSIRRTADEDLPETTRKLRDFAGWAITMLIVLVSWVFFRSPTFTLAATILRKMFLFEGGIAWYHPFTIFAILLMTAQHLMAYFKKTRGLLVLEPDNLLTPVVLFTMVWLVIIFYPKGFTPFIYFQF